MAFQSGISVKGDRLWPNIERPILLIVTD